MKYYVNDNCIACGLCETICPEIFSLNSDRAEAQDIDAKDETNDKAQEAMNSCPVDAIEEK